MSPVIGALASPSGVRLTDASRAANSPIVPSWGNHNKDIRRLQIAKDRFVHQRRCRPQLSGKKIELGDPFS